MKLESVALAFAALAPACVAFTFAGPRQVNLIRIASEAVEAASEEAAPVEAAVEAVVEAVADEPVVEAVAEEAAAPVEAAAAAAPARASKEGATALADIVSGQSYDGTVVGVAAYGAFVDIGAVSDGLVHISELSDRFVSDVSSIVSVGDAVKVRVMACDEEKKQLSLSMKPEGSGGGGGGGGGQQQSRGGGGGGRGMSRGAKIELLKSYVNADETAFIDGTVSNVQSWGAFVTIADGVDGLVHVSRVADERTEDLESVLSPGQAVKVRVIDVDLEKGTLALAMDSYRERRPYDAGDDSGEGGGGSGERSRAPRFYAAGEGGEEGSRRRPQRQQRAEPGDDIWETKPSEMFDWREALANEQAAAILTAVDEDDSAFKLDAEGKLVLN